MPRGDLSLRMKTGSPVFVAARRGKPSRLAWTKRLSSSKGQNRRKTATQSHGSRKSGMGTSSSLLSSRLPGCRRGGPVKSPSVPRRRSQKERHLPGSGTVLGRLRAACLHFCSRHSLDSALIQAGSGKGEQGHANNDKPAFFINHIMHDERRNRADISGDRIVSISCKKSVNSRPPVSLISRIPAVTSSSEY